MSEYIQVPTHLRMRIKAYEEHLHETGQFDKEDVLKRMRQHVDTIEVSFHDLASQAVDLEMYIEEQMKRTA